MQKKQWVKLNAIIWINQTYASFSDNQILHQAIPEEHLLKIPKSQRHLPAPIKKNLTNSNSSFLSNHTILAKKRYVFTILEF